MKKFLFLGLAAMMAFTSCTKDETLATAQPGAIAFEQAFVGKATRSNIDPSITKVTLGQFDVYAFMDEPSGIVFNKELVSSTDEGKTWSYVNTAYWAANHDYYFGALAPVGKYELNTENANTYGVGVVSFTNDGKTDLLYAPATATTQGVDLATTTMQPVALTFNHLLSKVKFSFVNGFTNDAMTITVEDIKITNGYTKASLALNVEDWWTVPAWDFTGDAAALTHEFGNVTKEGETDAEVLYNIPAYGKEGESHNELLLFPASDKTFAVEFTVKVWNGTVLSAEKTHKVEVVTTLNMGYAYDFKAELNASNVLGEDNAMQPIEFTVTTVKGWDQAGEVEVPVTKYENVTVAAGETMTLGGDGTIVGTMNVAGTLDGANFTLAAEAAPANNGMIRPTGTATVQNVNIDGKGVRTTDDKSIRGIYITTNGNYVIEGVKILNCGYAFNAQTSAQSSLEVSESTFEGWSSYDLDGTVNVTDVLAKFTKVNFTRGAYEKLVDDKGNLLKNGWLRPYNSTILTDCTFEEGYTIDLGSLVAGGTVKFVDCTYGTTVITAANIESLGFVENYDAAKVAF